MLIHEAIEFAAVKHRNQVRKGTDTPYIVHPMEVMYILAENGVGDSDTLAAITGGIAEAYFGAPFELRKKAERYLENDTFRPIYTWLKRFEKMFP